MADREISYWIKARDGATAVMRQIENAAGGLSAKLFSIKGMMASVTAAVAGFSVGALFKAAVQQAAEFETNLSRLRLTIGNLGGDFGKLRPSIDAAIGSLAKSTTFKDDDLLAGLETLMRVSGDVKGSLQNIGLAADVSRAKQIDLGTAAELVGKVMVGETAMLKKFGIIVKEGDDALALMQQRMGGFASNEANTLAGRLTQISNGFESFLQALGQAITGGDQFTSGTNAVVDVLARMERWIVQNEDAIATLTNATITVITWVGKLAADIIWLTQVGFKGWGLAIDAVGAGFLNFGERIRYGLGSGLKAIGEWTEAASGFFDQFGIHLDDVGEKMANLGTKMMTTAIRNKAANDRAFNAAADDVALFTERNVVRGRPGASAPGAGSGKPTKTGISDDEKRKAAEVLKFAQDAVRQMQTEVGKGVAATTKSGLDDALAAVDAFTREANAKIQELVAKKAPQAEIDAFTATAQARQQQLVDAAVKAGEDEAKKRGQAMRELLASMTPSLVDDMRFALAKLQDQLREEGQSQAFIDQVTAIQTSLIGAQATTEQVTAALERLQAAGLKPMAEQRALSDLARDVQRQVDALGTGNEKTKARLELEKQLAAIEARKNELADENLKTVDAQIAAEDELATHAGDVAATVESAANAAYGLVQAFGAGNTELGRMIASVGQIAGGISKIMAGASGGSLFGAIGAVVGGGIALGSVLTGDSQAEQERKRVLEENTKAIRELTAKGGLLGTVDVSGAAVAEAMRALAVVTGRFSAQDVRYAQVGGANTRADLSGLTPRQLDAISAAAKALGITLDDTQQGFYDLQRALSRSMQVLGEFGDDVEGQFRQLDAFQKIFGAGGPLDDLSLILAQLGDTSPALSDLFQGIDLASNEGRDALRKRVQDVFTTMMAGGDTLGAAGLGDLSGDQFLSLLERIIADLDTAGRVAGAVAPTLGGVLQQLAQGFQIFGTMDPSEQLSETVAAMGAFSPALAQLADGLDLASSEGLASFTERVRDLWRQAKDGGEDIDLGTLSLEELMQALLDLANGATSAAGAIVTAAGQMDAALSALTQDWEVLGVTDPSQRASGTIGALSGKDADFDAVLAGIDLSTQEGRDAGIASLREFYKSHKNLGSEILSLINSIQAIPGVADAAADVGRIGARGGDSASTGAFASGFQAVTTSQASGLLDYDKRILGVLVDIRDLMRQTVSVAAPAPVTFGGFAGAAVRAGGGDVRIGPINVHVHTSDEDAEQFGERVAHTIERELDKTYGGKLLRQKLYRGEIGV